MARRLRSVATRRLTTTLTLEGVPELAAALRKVARDVEADEVIDRALMPAAEMLRDAIRARAPVRTGKLRDAVFAGRGDPRRDPFGPTVLYGVNERKAPHAHFLEFGTSRAPAHPFVRPAVAATAPAAAARIAQGISVILARYK